MKESVGHLHGKGLKIGIVISRFNELITKSLLSGAIDALTRHGVKSDDIHIVWVPGAFEIPLIAKKLALSNNFHAVVCLGAVIRGATPHFEYVSSPVASGISRIALESDIPVLFGVLTTENIDQALERAGTKSGNKGFDVAVNAIEMANLLSSLN